MPSEFNVFLEHVLALDYYTKPDYQVTWKLKMYYMAVTTVYLTINPCFVRHITTWNYVASLIIWHSVYKSGYNNTDIFVVDRFWRVFFLYSAPDVSVWQQHERAHHHRERGIWLGENWDGLHDVRHHTDCSATKHTAYSGYDWVRITCMNISPVMFCLSGSLACSLPLAQSFIANWSVKDPHVH